jgi:hypothetical protein
MQPTNPSALSGTANACTPYPNIMCMRHNAMAATHKPCDVRMVKGVSVGGERGKERVTKRGHYTDNVCAQYRVSVGVFNPCTRASVCVGRMYVYQYACMHNTDTRLFTNETECVCTIRVLQ